MSLEKLITIDQVEVTENGTVQVRTKTAIVEDGVQISGSFHRHVVAPGDDYSAEHDRVVTICQAIHTPDVVAAYKAAQQVIEG